MIRNPVGMVEFDVVKLYPLLQYVNLKVNARRDYHLTGTYRFNNVIHWRFAITGTFQYPYEQPLLTDYSYPEKHLIEFHMSNKGLCCVEEPYLMQSESIKGIRLYEYVQNYVLPFYGNLLYRIKFGYYLNEWAHGELGLKEARIQRYGLGDMTTFNQALSSIKRSEVFTVNSRCFCGERRISPEHLQLVANLQKLHPLIWRKLLMDKSPC